MSSIDFSGKWHNQHCSEMELKIGASGRVTGTYQTGVGSPESTEKSDLVGFVTNDQISFTVNFGRYDSLTAWVGQDTEDVNGEESIETYWHLTRNIPDAEEPERIWASVITGHDVFRRGPTPPGCKPQVSRVPSHPLVRR